MSTDIYVELDRHCRGFARIKLDNIDFDSGRDLDDQKVNRLVKVFELEPQGCERASLANAIPVIVGKDILANLFPPGHLYSTTLHSLVPDQLPWLSTRVICLHGKHRIHAARKFLRIHDRWWTVKIFDSGRNINIEAGADADNFDSDLPLYAQEHIRYECSNTLQFSNGDILRHHLDAEKRGDQDLADTWFARLPVGRHVRVRQLKKNDELLEALLSLLPYAALWTDYDLGTLEHELAMRCPEVFSSRTALSDLN